MKYTSKNGFTIGDIVVTKKEERSYSWKKGTKAKVVGFDITNGLLNVRWFANQKNKNGANLNQSNGGYNFSSFEVLHKKLNYEVYT